MREKHISEKYLVKRLEDYWHRLKGGSSLPSIHRFNAGHIQDVWDNCFRALVLGEAHRTLYRYEYMGAEVRAAYGKSLVGETVTSGVQMWAGAPILKVADACIAEKKPVSGSGQFVGRRDMIIRYQCCVLPFSMRQEEVTHVIAGIAWKAH